VACLHLTLADVNILELSSAADWVGFGQDVRSGSRRAPVPDWQCAAGVFDAVHMSLREVAAAQDMWFSGPGTIVATPYWDVESTPWLAWKVTSGEPVKVDG
jgi:hypothetical protein